MPHETSELDKFGCLISYNKAVVDYNNMLKEALSQTRRELPIASLIYVDTHAVLLQLFQDPTSHGNLHSLNKVNFHIAKLGFIVYFSSIYTLDESFFFFFFFLKQVLDMVLKLVVDMVVATIIFTQRFTVGIRR